MPNAARTPEPMTIEAFLGFLDRQPDHERWELHDGRPVMMVGGTLAHALIAGNIDRGIAAGARARGCLSLRGFLAKAGETSAFEPDVVVLCGRIDQRSRYSGDPVVVVEVLSPSTMRFDRVVKFERYRTIASLRQIVLVYQDSIRIESWRRAGDDWIDEPTVLTGRDDVLRIDAIEVEIPLRAIYEGLDDR